VSEKLPRNFVLEATNPGGHSSVPRRDSAIYDLVAALDRVSRLEFPVRLNDVSRGYAVRMAEAETGVRAKALRAIAAGNPSPEDIAAASEVPEYNAQLRTTCATTLISGGHAANALPQTATATVNCRIIPGETPEFVERELAKAAGDRVSVKMRGSVRGPSVPADLQSPFLGTIRRVSESVWPGVPVQPAMSTGATDGALLRNAGISVYGTSGVFVEFGENRMHGRDERVAVRAVMDAAEYMYRLTKAIASGE
jgi:acetylornithine deacetylase/succinyl-diaminopimelate desuccinylase-like protein